MTAVRVASENQERMAHLSMFTMFSGIISTMMFVLAEVPTLDHVDSIGLRIGAVSGLILSLGGLATAIGTQVSGWRKISSEQDQMKMTALTAVARAAELEKQLHELRELVYRNESRLPPQHHDNP